MKNETILVVDDQPFNLELLVQTLGSSYQVRVAMDGETALALAAQEIPDIVLLDVDLPGISGYEVCTRLKAGDATARTGVIFLTGMGEAEAEMRGLALGAVDFITKPFNPALVLARVESHLSLARAHRDLLHKQEEVLSNERMASLGRLLAGLAHELNTPLGNALLANSSLADGLGHLSSSNQDSSPQLRDFASRYRPMVDLVGRNLTQAAGLVEQVRQAFVDRSPEVPEILKLKDLFESALACHAHELSAAGLHTSLEGSQNLEFMASQSDLGELVSMLVANTLYRLSRSRTSGALQEPELKLIYHIDTQGRLNLTYEDSIPEAKPGETSHFFEPSFWSTPSSESPGLATYLLHSLVVHRLKGSIQASSRQGQGMVFELVIPPAAPQTR